MNIAIDIRHLAAPNQAGVGQYTMHIIKHMVEAAPEDHFFLFAAGTQKTLAYLPSFEAKNVTVVKTPIPNRLLFLLFLLKLRTLESFLPRRPDILWLPNHNIVHTNLPYVLTVHDLSFDIFPEFFTRKDRLRYWIGKVKQQTQSAQRLLAVSESTKNDLQTRWQINEQRITVTPLAAGEEYHPNEHPSDKSYLAAHGIKVPYLLCLCTREPRKNLEAVVEAYDQYAQQTKKPPLLVIAGGRGWKSRHLDRLIEHKKSTTHVKVMGYVPEKHKSALYRHAKAFLFPSFYEGFGLPVLEAMQSGTPVIAGFSGSLPEVLSTHAILVDPFNVSDIVQALEQMNTPLRPSKNSGLRWGQTKTPQTPPPSLSWKQTAQQTLQALHTIM